MVESLANPSEGAVLDVCNLDAEAQQLRQGSDSEKNPQRVKFWTLVEFLENPSEGAVLDVCSLDAEAQQLRQGSDSEKNLRGYSSGIW